MPQPKLILIEGIPGSGKTSAAIFVTQWLETHGLQAALYLEGNLDHPADYESVAWFTPDAYNRLVNTYPEVRTVFESLVVRRGADWFISYRKLPEELPAALIDAVRQREIYELPMEEYKRLARLRWEDFARQAQRVPKVYVFECCFWQNPITVLLGRLNADQSTIQEHIERLNEQIDSLNPLLIYLDPGDPGGTLRKVAKERPVEWLNSVIAYTTGQAFGKANGLSGFEGMVRFYEAMQDLQTALLPGFPGQALKIPAANHNWIASYRRIEDFLTRAFA